MLSTLAIHFIVVFVFAEYQYAFHDVTGVALGDAKSGGHKALPFATEVIAKLGARGTPDARFGGRLARQSPVLVRPLAHGQRRWRFQRLPTTGQYQTKVRRVCRRLPVG